MRHLPFKLQAKDNNETDTAGHEGGWVRLGGPAKKQQQYTQVGAGLLEQDALQSLQPMLALSVQKNNWPSFACSQVGASSPMRTGQA
eukprot:1159770-Pelagomonas_calceolata.AAC.10